MTRKSTSRGSQAGRGKASKGKKAVKSKRNRSPFFRMCEEVVAELSLEMTLFEKPIRMLKKRLVQVFPGIDGSPPMQREKVTEFFRRVNSAPTESSIIAQLDSIYPPSVPSLVWDDNLDELPSLFPTTPPPLDISDNQGQVEPPQAPKSAIPVQTGSHRTTTTLALGGVVGEGFILAVDLRRSARFYIKDVVSLFVDPDDILDSTVEVEWEDSVVDVADLPNGVCRDAPIRDVRKRPAVDTRINEDAANLVLQENTTALPRGVLLSTVERVVECVRYEEGLYARVHWVNTVESIVSVPQAKIDEFLVRHFRETNFMQQLRRRRRLTTRN